MTNNLVKFIQRCEMSLTVGPKFGVSFSRFLCCGRHGHGLWPLCYRPFRIIQQTVFTVA